jgi:beta-galactosidase
MATKTIGTISILLMLASLPSWNRTSGEVANRYAKSPALSFYNIWNEPHYSSVAPHVVDRFRQWLKQKYDSLAALRHAWAEAYSDWSEESPFLTENWKSSMPQIDWIEFRNDLNGMLLGELIRTLRKFDSTHVVNANPVGSVWASFAPLGAYNIDDWPIADKNDIHGISYYPDGWERSHDLEPCPFWLHNLAFNAVRSAARGKNFILTELYTNTQNGLALNGYLDKQSISLLAWTALANDCKGMIYWKWLPFMRGRQTLGRGLCQVDGKLAPRGEAVKDIAVVMRKYGQMLCKARLRKPQAAILVDMTGLIKTLEQTTEPATNKFMYESYAGLFKALHEGNVPVDMVRMDRSLDGETLKGYKIIYLPFQIVMRREVAEVLKAYVRQGGWVVADARTATLDELDFAYPISPGAGLDELFGATRSDWIGAKTVYKVHMEESSGSSPTDFYGRFFREKIELHGDVQTLGTFVDTHTPAITRKGYGKGVAILSAVPLGASYYGLPGQSCEPARVGIRKRSRSCARCSLCF